MSFVIINKISLKLITGQHVWPSMDLSSQYPILTGHRLLTGHYFKHLGLQAIKNTPHKIVIHMAVVKTTSTSVQANIFTFSGSYLILQLS